MVHIWYKTRFLTPAQFVAKTKRVSHVCRGPNYLDCVTEHAEVQDMAKEFARVLKNPALENPRLLKKYFQKCSENSC